MIKLFTRTVISLMFMSIGSVAVAQELTSKQKVKNWEKNLQVFVRCHTLLHEMYKINSSNSHKIHRFNQYININAKAYHSHSISMLSESGEWASAKIGLQIAQVRMDALKESANGNRELLSKATYECSALYDRLEESR
ncbi:MAG: hypothetical protein V7784_15920 [Oceanospirillaceae bacterium]